MILTKGKVVLADLAGDEGQGLTAPRRQSDPVFYSAAREAGLELIA